MLFIKSNYYKEYIYKNIFIKFNMTTYFSHGRKTLDPKIIKIIDQNAEYCNWHSHENIDHKNLKEYENVDGIDERFFGKIDSDGKVYDNCCYLGTKSWDKFNADMKTIKKKYETYVKNIKKSINLIEEYNKSKIKNLQKLLEDVLKLMYLYKEKDILYFYKLYKENYSTFYLYNLYKDELKKIKNKNSHFDNMYEKILSECDDDDDQMVKPEREVKLKTTTYLDLNGNMKELKSNSKQLIINL